MKNNIIEEYKNETNDILIKKLGMTFEEFRSLTPDELKIIFFSYKFKKLKKHADKTKNNDVDSILNNFKEETNQIIMKKYGITFDEFTMLGIPDLIELVRKDKKHTR